MKFSTLMLAGTAAAFPQAMHKLTPRAPEGCSVSAQCDERIEIDDATIGWDAQNPNLFQKLSAARTNCGAQSIGGCAPFNAKDQFVSVTGQHAYRKPSADEIRGPCPGLNAASNHGYLPRDGVASIIQTIDGLGAMFNMAPDLSGFLAAYAVVFDGDLITQTWSIGGPQTKPSLLNGILSGPQGISYSHNKYEGDTSIGRCDAFMNNGDAHSLSVERFKYAYEVGMDNDRYTLDKFSREFAKNTFRSERQNPMYYAAIFSTTLVSPAAYNFVINFMSNHSTEEKDGWLDGDMFKTWFAVEGDYPNFKWIPGEERIPDNWYKRPSVNAYTAGLGVFGDLAAQFLAYPTSIRIGGNANGVNSFKHADVSKMTGGTYNHTSFGDSNQLGCFMYQTLQQVVPDQLRGIVGDVTKAVNLLTGYMDKAFGLFECPEMSAFDNNDITGLPGHSYSPSGPATNC